MAETELSASTVDKSLLRFQADFVDIGRRKGVSDCSEFEAKHPKWFDLELIQTGQTFIRKHLFSVFFAHLISLILLLCYLPVRYTLLRTGRSDTMPKAIRRYLMTLIHIKGWYEGEFVSENGSSPMGPAVQDIRKIRTLHCRLSKKLSTNPASTSVVLKTEEDAFIDKKNKLVKAVREDLQSACCDPAGSPVSITEDPTLPVISQLDMAVTQFCFMGFISLYPASFGIRESTDLGLKGFVHLWAVIGYHLGIEDQFNICLDANMNTRQLIVSKILLPNLQACDRDTVKLWTSLTQAVASIIPFVSLHALLLYIVEKLFNTQSEQISSLFNTYDSICYKIMNYCFNTWTDTFIVRSAINALLRLAVHLTALRIFPTSTPLPVTTTQVQQNNNNNHLHTTPRTTSHV